MDFIDSIKEKICYEESRTDNCSSCRHCVLNRVFQEDSAEYRCHLVTIEDFEVQPDAKCMYYKVKPVN